MTSVLIIRFAQCAVIRHNVLWRQKGWDRGRWVGDSTRLLRCSAEEMGEGKEGGEKGGGGGCNVWVARYLCA